MNRQRIAKSYLWLVVIVGAAVCCFSAARLWYVPVGALDWRILLLFAVTIFVGRRLIITIPQGNGEISVIDTFIFLTMLLYGGEAAILLATAEAVYSKTRNNRKPITILFAGGVLACSTFLTVWALRFSFGSITAHLSGELSATFVAALGVMALTQFVANTGLVAVGVALKNNQPIWQTWTKYYFWSSITYFAGASAAGITAKIIHVAGFSGVFVTIPIIALVYFTYRMSVANIEASLAQAERSERHAAALRESEERFHGAFANASVGMALVALDGRFLQLNRSVCEITGYHERELLDSNLQSLAHPDDLEMALSCARHLLAGDAQTYQIESRCLHHRGDVVWTLVSISLVRDTKERPQYFVFQMQDITERKRAEELLIQSERLKSALLHAVTHDLRTPLTSIKACVTTLLNEWEGEPEQVVALDAEGRREFLEIIDEETDRLNRFIEDHMRLARLEAGQLHLRWSSCKVDEIVENVLERAASLVGQHRTEVMVEDELPAVCVDASAVEEVIYVLLDNATKYSPKETPLRLSVSRASSEAIRVAVEDEGCGVPANLRQRVFEKFFRVFRDGPTRLDRPAGTGLGLAIAREIVETHGGRIWIEDGSGGQGTRVIFTLPINGAARPAERRALAPVETARRAVDQAPAFIRVA